MENYDYSVLFTVNGTVTHCLNDTSCPLSSICYFIDSNSTIGVCGCNFEYGESGDQCNQRNQTGTYRMVTLSILTIFGLVILMMNCRELLVLGMQGILKKFDAKVTTLLATLVTILLGLIRDVSGLILLTSPNKYIVITKTSKSRPLLTTRVLAAGLILVIGVFAIMNIGVVWLKIAIASKKFMRIGNSNLSKKAALAVIVFDVVLLVGSIFVTRIDASLSIAVTLPYLVIAAIIYAYCAYSITKVIAQGISMRSKTNHVSVDAPGDSNKSGEDSMSRALKRIKITCILVVICLLLLAIFTSIYLRLQLNAKKMIPDGKIYTPAILADLISVAVYAMMFVVLWYLHEQVQSSVTNSKGKQGATAIVTSIERETMKPTQTS